MRIDSSASRALNATVRRRGGAGLSTQRPNPGQAARPVKGDDRANPAGRAVVPVGPRREHEHPSRFAGLTAFAPFITQLLATPRPLEEPSRAATPTDAYHAAADRVIRDLRGARVDQVA